MVRSHHTCYSGVNLNFFDVDRAYWIARVMKIGIVVANCRKDS